MVERVERVESVDRIKVKVKVCAGPRFGGKGVVCG